MTRRRQITPQPEAQDEIVTEAIEVEIPKIITEIEEEKEVEVEAVIEPEQEPEPAPVYVAPVPPRAPIPPNPKQEEIQRRNIPRFSTMR